MSEYRASLDAQWLEFVVELSKGKPPDEMIQTAMRAIDQIVRDAVLAEREACAKIADDLATGSLEGEQMAGYIAEQIRARP